ncbi:hypothetical protein CsSME_00022489 [Camellia sinensis var. sinensis]
MYHVVRHRSKVSSIDLNPFCQANLLCLTASPYYYITVK